VLRNSRSIPNHGLNYGRASIPLLGGMLVAVMLAVVFWVTQRPDLSRPIAENTAPVDTSVSVVTAADSPVASDTTLLAETSSATKDLSPELQAAPVNLETSAVGAITAVSLSPEALAADAAGLSEDELTEIGTAAYSDAEFELLQELIDDNPVVLGQLLELYRANTDASRANRLAELLGRFDDSAITELGAELVFSGDPDSQKAGLRLLGRQQPRSAEAREVVRQVLDVETNPELLVSALNAVAKQRSASRYWISSRRCRNTLILGSGATVSR